MNGMFENIVNNVIKKHQVKVKFIIVGVWNTIFGYFVFVGLDIVFESLFPKRYIAYMAAAVLANILAIVNAFIFHKYITFQSKARGKSFVIEFVRFFSTYIVTIIIGLISLPIFVEVFHLNPKISGALLIPITTIMSYYGHSQFSFKR